MIENELFKEYKAYILANSMFASKLQNSIFNATPKQLANFPTIIMRQMNESDYMQGKTTDRLEYVSRLNYRVSIYVKPIVLNGTKYQPRQVIDELRKLTSDFFRNVGLDKDNDRPVDNIDLEISRQEMLFSGRLASWNNSLYF